MVGHTARPIRALTAAAVLAAAVSLGTAHAQAGKVAIEASPERPAAGEGFQLIVTYVSQADTAGGVMRIAGSPRVFWPDLSSIGLQRRPGDRSSTRISSVNGRMATVTQQSIALVANQPGFYVIPTIRVDVDNTPKTTTPLTIEVVGASPAGSGSVTTGPGGHHRALLAAVVAFASVGLLCLAVIVGRRMGRARTVADDPGSDARDTTARALARLERLARQGDARPFYNALAALLREQFSEALGRDATRLTTTELLAACGEHVRDPGWVAALEDCLVSADRVRFGAGEATHADSARHLQLARILVAASRRGDRHLP